MWRFCFVVGVGKEMNVCEYPIGLLRRGYDVLR
jgi:hypothetical protein